MKFYIIASVGDTSFFFIYFKEIITGFVLPVRYVTAVITGLLSAYIKCAGTPVFHQSFLTSPLEYLLSFYTM